MESDVAVQVALVTAGAALAGVLLTSFLSAVSSWFKERRVEKRELGVLVAELYRLHHEMGEMKDNIMRGAALAQERARNPTAAEKTELDFMTKLRLKTNTKYLFDYKGLSEAIEATKKHIAARNPVAATRLDGVTDILWAMKQGSRDVLGEVDKTEYLATVALGFDAHEPELARLVLVLARMHGPLTWWRVKRAWKARIRDNGGWVKEPPPDTPPPASET